MQAVPSNKVGLVMGKGGETIRNICSQSGAHCQVTANPPNRFPTSGFLTSSDPGAQVDKAAPEGAREKSIVIKGSAEAVERARGMGCPRMHNHWAGNACNHDCQGECACTGGVRALSDLTTWL